jgi:predicted nucleotidyltransferase
VARLSPLERSTLECFCSRLRGALGDRIERMVLFGSRARGEGHAESDLDVLIVLRGEIDLRTRRMVQDIAADVTLEADVRVSPLLRDTSFGVRTALARTIAREGILL